MGSSDTLAILSVLQDGSTQNSNLMPADLASPSNILTASLAMDSSCTSTGVMTNNPESSLDIVSTSTTCQ